MGEKEKPEQEGLGKFASSALRGPRRGIYQNLLADLLYQAVKTSDPLTKIVKICEAAKMSTQKEQLDAELIDVCFTVSLGFINTDIKTKQYVRIIWGFPKTEENFNKYILPWHKMDLRYYPTETFYSNDKYPKRYVDTGASINYRNKYLEEQEAITKKVGEELSNLPKHQGIFEASSALYHSSFLAMRNEFCRWALMQLLPIQAIISEEIDPNIWAETREQNRQVEREGEQDTNTMG